MKTCACCHIEKPMAAFGASSHYSSGINNRCKTCCTAASKRSEDKHGPYVADPIKAALRVRRFHEKNPVKASEYWKRRYAEHKEEILAAQRKLRHRPDQIEKARAYYEANAEKIKASAAAWQKANPEICRAKNKAFLEVNPNKKRQYYEAWIKRYPGRKNQLAKAWHKAHPEQKTADTALRRANKKNATPAWANQFFIREAYHLAKLRTKATGFKWEVDHIYPLQSVVVCGLHVEHNLQVIPAVLNRSKGNKVLHHG